MKTIMFLLLVPMLFFANVDAYQFVVCDGVTYPEGTFCGEPEKNVEPTKEYKDEDKKKDKDKKKK